ncbi:MAG: nitrogen fixation negative regulator NifL [Zoogloeaceae bacterium]|jgi:nitrogen fixation negative regulator NifL|nr:nitrogen fixation negative regulator NifL [Zoogloeaceae bacterium]
MFQGSRHESLYHRAQENARLVALGAQVAEEEHAAALRESLSATLFRLEGPLNVMASVIARLQSREPDMAKALQSALQEGRAHLEDLRQLIAQSHQEAISPVNLNEALRDVLNVCTPRLLASGITLHWQPAAILPSVLGRPIELRALFKALVDNAIDALSTRGWKTREIRLATRAETGVLVSIEDTGPGIPAGLEIKVFEPFFTTHARRTGHLGTGLSRAQQVVTEHGGLLDLLPAPGGGCRVLVELPTRNAA